jgi:phosphoribosylanthranilate isomerase
MPLKTLVKVSKISNLSDARYCAGMGVEMLGFRVIPGKEDYINPELFQDIRGWISGPKVIAELYGVSNTDEIDFVIQTYAPDYFELTYSEYKSFKQVLPLPCIVYLPVATVNAGSIDHDANVSYILVDEPTRCSHIATPYPVLIKITSPEKLNEKLAEGCFNGFVLDGPKELRPGVTNYEQLGGILEALEEDS